VPSQRDFCHLSATKVFRNDEATPSSIDRSANFRTPSNCAPMACSRRRSRSSTTRKRSSPRRQPRTKTGPRG
jgi:hypothetical protein